MKDCDLAKKIYQYVLGLNRNSINWSDEDDKTAIDHISNLILIHRNDKSKDKFELEEVN